MENVFDVVPDVVDWIPAQDLGRSTQVCREWKRTLSKDKVTRRQLAWRWPLLGILFGHTPDDWVPTQIVSDLEHGLLDRQVAFDRRTQSVDWHITSGWSNWLNGHAPFESAFLDFKYHRYQSDTQFVSVISDFIFVSVRSDFKYHGHQLVSFDADNIVFKIVPSLYIYDKIFCIRSCPCPARSEIAEMYAVVNLHSLSTNGAYTWGWRGFTNGRAQTWSRGTISRPFLDEGFEKLMETDEFNLFRRNS
jgi:hypothetical protein